MAPIRKVRFKEPAQSTLEEVTSGSTSVKKLLTLAGTLGEEELGQSINEEQAGALADQGYASDTMQKELEKEVKVIKAVLMAYGKKTKSTSITGKEGMALISAATSNVVGSATQLAKILKKEGKTQLFDALVSVRVGDVKKYLGEIMLKEYNFIKSETEKFGKIGFKPRKR